jgi:hypothetical protein
MRCSFNGVGSMRNGGEVEMLGHRVMRGKEEEMTTYKGGTAHSGARLYRSQRWQVACAPGGWGRRGLVRVGQVDHGLASSGDERKQMGRDDGLGQNEGRKILDC